MHHAWLPNRHVLVPSYNELMLYDLEFVEHFERGSFSHFIKLKVECFRRMAVYAIKSNSGCFSVPQFTSLYLVGKRHNNTSWEFVEYEVKVETDKQNKNIPSKSLYFLFVIRSHIHTCV